MPDQPVFGKLRSQRGDLAGIAAVEWRQCGQRVGVGLRAHWIAFALRAPVFALGSARRAVDGAFALGAPVFALGSARRAHEVSARFLEIEFSMQPWRRSRPLPRAFALPTHGAAML